MSGLNRTPGKRVQGNALTRVQIPLSPPYEVYATQAVAVKVCGYRLSVPTRYTYGRLPERFMGTAWNAVEGKPSRGFESHTFRHYRVLPRERACLDSFTYLSRIPIYPIRREIAQWAEQRVHIAQGGGSNPSLTTP